MFFRGLITPVPCLNDREAGLAGGRVSLSRCQASIPLPPRLVHPSLRSCEPGTRGFCLHLSTETPGPRGCCGAGGGGTPGSQPDREAPELALADPVHQPVTRTDSPAQIIVALCSDCHVWGIPFCPPHWNVTMGTRTP